MATKERLSVSIDAHLIDAGRAAVSAGRSNSLSAWVNGALERQAAHERRLRALDEFFRAYEEEHGEITVAEMEAARRRFKERGIVVRGAVVREPPHEGDAPR
jgi:Arc/MetJ-type ribon-helix-helix transcriptional regulator